jgi:CheY-like chemotaxis protein
MRSAASFSDPNGIKSIPAFKSEVLLIDDDLATYYLTSELLSDYQVNVVHAICGYEGVYIALNNPCIQLVITELRLPGLNGYEVLKRIRNLNSQIPIWAQTALVEYSTKECCLNAGFNEFIEKPVDLKNFWKRAAMYLTNVNH